MEKPKWRRDAFDATVSRCQSDNWGSSQDPRQPCRIGLPLSEETRPPNSHAVRRTPYLNYEEVVEDGPGLMLGI